MGFHKVLYFLNKYLPYFPEQIYGNYLEKEKDIVLVTGGASGLGKELVRIFLEQGITTVIFDLTIPQDEDKLQNAFYYKCDVSDPAEIEKNQKAVKQEIGTVTVLINNAAIASGKTILELSNEEVNKIIQVNLLASFYTIKSFLPDMLDLKRGYVVNVASVLGYMSPSHLSAYGASKAGLIALNESLTYELGSPFFNLSGVKTLLVCPGQLSTGLFGKVKTPSTLLASEVDPKKLAFLIFDALQYGKRGSVKAPIYAYFLPMFRAFPWQIVEPTRKLAGIDTCMKSFNDTTLI